MIVGEAVWVCYVVTTTGNRFDGWIFEWIQLGRILGKALRVVPKESTRRKMPTINRKKILLALKRRRQETFWRREKRKQTTFFVWALTINSITMALRYRMKTFALSKRKRKEERPCFSRDVMQHASWAFMNYPADVVNKRTERKDMQKDDSQNDQDNVFLHGQKKRRDLENRRATR